MQITRNNEQCTCSHCVKTEPHVHTQLNSKLKCIDGKCVDVYEPHFYEFYNEPAVSAVSKLNARYGDLLCRRNNLNCSEVYIVDKNKNAEQLKINSESRHIIPDSYVDKLGLHYWHRVSEKARLADVYNRTRTTKLMRDLVSKKIELTALIKRFGEHTVDKLVDHKGRAAPLNPRVLRTVVF